MNPEEKHVTRVTLSNGQAIDAVGEPAAIAVRLGAGGFKLLERTVGGPLWVNVAHVIHVEERPAPRAVGFS